MIIENKYLYYKTLDGFLAALSNGFVRHDSIVFIEDVMLIWTHGTYFCGASATVDEELSTTSENAVQNKVITAALSDKVNTDQLEYYSKLEDFYKFTDSINTKVNK